MKKLLITLFILVTVAANSAKADMIQNADGVWVNTLKKVTSKTTAPKSSFCSEKWGSDYVMIEHCIKSQGKAANNVLNTNDINEGSEVYNTIHDTCALKWYDGENFDWVMVEHCINSQIDSYNNINK